MSAISIWSFGHIVADVIVIDIRIRCKKQNKHFLFFGSKLEKNIATVP